MTGHETEGLLEAYAEVADHRARRISELVAEREELRRRLAVRDDGAQHLAELEVENARLRRETRVMRARLDRLSRFPPYRAARALRRAIRTRSEAG